MTVSRGVVTAGGAGVDDEDAAATGMGDEVGGPGVFVQDDEEEVARDSMPTAGRPMCFS